jgi:RNA polymerase sigma-70 factor (ECF subfamily)
MPPKPSYVRACEEHIWEIYAFLAYRTGSRADAEDLTQETFERALKAWGRYDPARASVRTWLTAIAHNLLIDHYRSSHSHREFPLEDEPSFEAPEMLPDLGLDPALARALDSLGERDREIVALRFGGDLSGPEIAALMNLSLANVQQILSRALRRLRTEIDGEDASGSVARSERPSVVDDKPSAPRRASRRRT